MAIQDFVTGQVLTAAQMDTLQANDYNQTVSAKVASYVLVAADAGTRITMSNAGATTITVNTSLFTAGDTLFITNIGAGATTITAGTATVSTASSLVLAQYDSGRLYFTSTGVAIWEKYQGAAASGGKILQVIYASSATSTAIATTTYTDTTLTASITPTSATSRILVLVQQAIEYTRSSASQGVGIQILRGASVIFLPTPGRYEAAYMATATSPDNIATIPLHYVDSPATTSATTYKTQAAPFASASGGSVTAQPNSAISTMILMEVGA